jgi:magnesium-transporting ATPase (P-type)
VSTLSADEAALATAESSAQSLQQQMGNAVQDRGSSKQVQSATPQGTSSSTTSALVQIDTSSSSTSAPSSAQPDSSSSSSSSEQQHHTKGFGVTVSQLRQLVQAGVDESQADAAAGLIRALSQQLSVKQQQRKQHKAAHNTNSADSAAVSSSSSLSSITFPDSSSSNGRTSTSNGAAAAANSTASSSLAVLPRALASALGSSLSKGLPGSEADTAARVAAFGSNSLAAAATSSFWQLLLEAASDSTLLLLMAAGAVSLGLAASTGKEAMDFIDGAAILASVAICVTVTAVTNYQKEAKFRQLNSLKENIPVSAGCCWVVWGVGCE